MKGVAGGWQSTCYFFSQFLFFGRCLSEVNRLPTFTFHNNEGLPAVNIKPAPSGQQTLHILTREHRACLACCAIIQQTAPELRNYKLRNFRHVQFKKKRIKN